MVHFCLHFCICICDIMYIFTNSVWVLWKSTIFCDCWWWLIKIETCPHNLLFKDVIRRQSAFWLQTKQYVAVGLFGLCKCSWTHALLQSEHCETYSRVECSVRFFFCGIRWIQWQNAMAHLALFALCPPACQFSCNFLVHFVLSFPKASHHSVDFAFSSSCRWR